MRRHPDHDRHRRPRASGRAPRLERVRCVLVKGSGAVVLMLNGTGRLKVRRGRRDQFHFEGRGTPRFLPDDCILMAGADGRLEVRGLQLELEFTGGTAEIRVEGEFEVDSARQRRHGLRAGLRTA